MAHLPTTVRGTLIVFLALAVTIPALVWFSIALSGPIVWMGIAVVALVAIAIVLRRRQLDAARERAYDPALGFTNVVARMRAENALADEQRAQLQAQRSLPTDR
jgi:hypothetical protein